MPNGAHDPRADGDWLGFDPRAEQDAGIGEMAATAIIPERRLRPRAIYFPDFIDSIQHSADFLEFVLGFSKNLNWTRDRACELRRLSRFDLAPQKWLSHLAMNFRFPLIDIPFAGEDERRLIIAEIVTLYGRRGTLWAIERLCELLGFGVLFDEQYHVTWIWNRHRFFGPANISELIFLKDFDDGTSQGFANEPLGNFYSAAGVYRGVGDPGSGNHTDQSANIAETTRDYILTFNFEMISWADPAEFGANLIWESVDAVFRCYFYRTAASTAFGIARMTGQLPGIIIGGLVPASIDITSGVHTVTIWDNVLHFSGYVDNQCIFCGHNYEGTTGYDWQRNKKGLWIDDSTQVNFDNFKVQTVDTRKQPKTWAPGVFDKNLYITLTGSPSHAAAKREYLEKVLPRWFVPMGTEVVIL